MSIESNPNNDLREISVLRCLAVISLVVWHTICIYIYEEWGGLKTPASAFYAKFGEVFIPFANMPLFTFIAGYLLAYLMSIGKYVSTKEFLLKKVHRLLIPYVILGILMTVAQPNLTWGGGGIIWHP